MKHIRALIILSLCICFSKTYGQISTEEIPISFSSDIASLKTRTSIDLKTMPLLDMERISQEDLQDEKEGIPPRFGFPHKVNFDLTNSGTWTTLNNGDKIWLLNVYCPNALSINILYEKFWIPEKAKFFVYSSNKKHILGAFTSKNNKGKKNDVEGFATGIVYGDKITLEYYQPAEIQEQGIISIAYVIHGYRYIKLTENKTENLESSGNCQVNINCSEGTNWQNEKNAVALILVNGNRYCTGSLINTTANDNRPLFLTADHCLGGWANDPIKYDAINNPLLNHWSFYWIYESPDCSNTSEPPIKSTVGATVLANNSISDFALLQLSENPLNKAGVIPYYLGWDRSEIPESGGVGIHHPNGDVKKIATYNITPSNSNCFSSGNSFFWKVNWQSTTHGWSVTEGGSSGSPLINSYRKVIGQLYGPGQCSNPNCSNPAEDIANYGKLSISWTGNNNADNRRRLDHWLDPGGTNPLTLSGKYPYSIVGPSIVCDQATYTITNLPQGATIQWSTSNNNLTLVSGQGTGTAVFNANGNGSCAVYANVNSISTNISVKVGSPTVAPSIVGDAIVMCGYNIYREANAKPVTWKVSGPMRISGTNYGYKCNVVATGNGYGWIQATTSNECGSIMSEIPVEVVCSDYNPFFSPNPSNEQTTISIELAQKAKIEEQTEEEIETGAKALDESIPWKLEVYTLNQQLKETKNIPSGKSTVINTHSWPEGLYIVKITYNGEILTGKLVVKH